MNYTMNLDMDLMIKTNTLYVTLIWAKYDYGNLIIPFTDCGSKYSQMWKGIRSNWYLVESYMSYGIHNGHYVRFWHDYSVPWFDKLLDMVNFVSSYSHKYTINDYVSLYDWNLNSIKNAPL